MRPHQRVARGRQGRHQGDQEEADSECGQELHGGDVHPDGAGDLCQELREAPACARLPQGVHF